MSAVSMAPITGARSIAKMVRLRNTNLAVSSITRSRKQILTRSMSSIRAQSHGKIIHQTVRALPTTSYRCFASESATSNKPTLSTKDFKYCVDLVQNRDRESYLCGLLMPADARKSYFAIRAWNVELASIKESSTQKNNNSGEPNVALQVRFQWWWDALNQIYENPQKEENDIEPKDYAPFSVSDTLAASYFKNPIVRVLKYAVHEKQLTRRFLERLSEAREADLSSEQPNTMQELIEYSDSIHSSLLYLTLETTDVRDESVDIVAQHAGIGIGLVTALRGIRMRLVRGDCPIPKELLPSDFPYDKLVFTNNSSFAEDEDDPALDPANQLTEAQHQILRDAVKEISVLGYSHLSEAQKLQSGVPKHAKTCFLPVIPAMHYLTKLEAAKYDIFDEKLLEHDNMTILARLGKSWLTGNF